MVAAAATPLDFHPDDTLAHRIVADLAEPTASLASVAESHNIPVATLALWLNSPRAVALLHAIESGTCRHLRMATSLHLTKAVDALLTILDHYKKLAATLDPADPDLLRAASRARIAAYHLFRLSRAAPLTDEQIALAAARAAERAASRAQANPAARAPARATALNQSEAASDSSTTPAAPSAPEAPTVPAAPAASSSPPLPIAHSPLPSSSSPSPSPSSPPLSAALRGESSSPLASSASPVLNTSPSSPLRDSESSATSAFSSPSLPSSPPLSAALRVESDSSPSRRPGPQGRRGPRPADLVRAATAAPLGSSP